MRHTFSADESLFSTVDSSAEFLCEGVTRNQSLIIRQAIEVLWQHKDVDTRYPNPLYVACQLKSMRADVPTIVSTLLGNDVLGREFPIEQVNEKFGGEIANLTRQVRWLNELAVSDVSADVRSPIHSDLHAHVESPSGLVAGSTEIHQSESQTHSRVANSLGSRDQAEMLRRMVLSMVEDVRVVLVKLSYRTQRLYNLVKSDSPDSRLVAHETMTIFAPLANRLGLGQLKWELEDVAFRILEPHAYKRIASALEENRASRESYINDFVADLEQRLQTNHLQDASVFGRPKHIYSIWKKMRSKRIEFNDLFDVRAVRVLVDDLSQCYGVLGIVHTAWQPIGREFDDYIAHPKNNGYQSLHTAVMGPGGKAVEVQIRTRAMDEEAENGVAAHWAYKEGATSDAVLQRSIDTLKQLLEDPDETLLEGFSQQLDTERVYVFTPKGEVIDLVKGATPLDFAYHVHSEIGHRCRGSKINGSIVNLTYELQNGDRVEVLTTREPAPSRDWLNQSLGYLKSSRARGKVRAWFNTQDHDQHLNDGRAILDRELRRLKAVNISIDKISKRLKFDKPAELYVALGRNDITVSQIAGAIDHLSAPDKIKKLTDGNANRQTRRSDSIRVRGVGNLLTNIATCCQPVPDDAIVGFITRSKGVSIHRASCSNMLNLPEDERQRLIDVEWGSDSTDKYPVDIVITAYDRVGLLRDVSTVMANNKADVIAVNTLSNQSDQTAEMKISVMVSNMQELNNLLENVRQLRNVSSVERQL